MPRLRWLLFAVALLAVGIWYVLPNKQKDPGPRLVADLEVEQREGPRGWGTLTSGVKKILQPYLAPVTPRDPAEVAERWITEPQEMRTGPSKRKLRLSTEWVYTVNNRRRIVEFVPIRGVKTGKDFVREVDRVKGETGAMIQLVFTEKDADPSPENRIVLTERLYMKNPSAALEGQMVKELGLKLLDQPDYAPSIKIYGAGDALQALASLESLEESAVGTEPTPVLAYAARPAAAPNDPLYAQQWHLKATNQTSANGQASVMLGEDCNVESVWGYPGSGGIRGRNITIAILDDGVELGHPDLSPNILASGHYDFLFPETDQTRGQLREHWFLQKENSTRGSLNKGQVIPVGKTGAWINEFLSDAGLPINQFIEVILSPDVSAPLDQVRLHLYQQRPDGLEYGLTLTMDSFTLGSTTSSGHRIYFQNLNYSNYNLFSVALEVGSSGIADTVSEYSDMVAKDGPAQNVYFKTTGTVQTKNTSSSRLTSFQFSDFEFPPAGNPVYFEENHGTSVAGVVAARGGNSLGVTGVAPEAKLHSFKILGNTPYGGIPTEANKFSSWIPTDCAGAALAKDNSSTHIKNNSWTRENYQGFDSLEVAALQNARLNGRSEKGTIVVFAAGNSRAESGRSDYRIHATDPGTIYVAALDHQGDQAAYSNPGSSVLVSAPSGNYFPSAPTTTTTDRIGSVGYNTNAANNNHSDLNYTASFNGTSSATPVVSGVVALMLEANPNLGWRDVQEILLRTARKNAPSDSGWAINGAGFPVNEKFGFGCVDAEAAVQMALSWGSNLPAQWIRSMTNSTSSAIGNNDGSVTERQFTVAADSRIRCESVAVTVNITHPSRGDLRVELISPAGTVSTLAAPFAANANIDNLSNWTYRTVRKWGERDAGTWTLRVRDQQAGQTGPASLDSVVLQIYGVDATNGPLPPAFLRLASGASVLEHAAINSVAAVVESSDEYGSDLISLIPGEGDAHNGYFEVSGKNLVVKQDIDFNHLSNGNYDALSNTYSLKVRLKATDPSGQYSLERALLLPVSAQNDHPPLEIYLQDYSGAFGVKSGHKIALLGPKNSGTPLGRICAFDQDRPDLGGDQFTYTLVDGVGADDNSKFSITGDILSTATSLAPLTLATYKIRVRGTDTGGSFIERSFLLLQTPTSNWDSDGDSWDDYLELVSFGSLAFGPWQDSDSDGLPNVFDSSPLEGPWTENGVKLSNEWLYCNPSIGSIYASDLNTVASLYDDRVTATYALVAGEGDQDNGKFQIFGSKLYVTGPILGSQQATYRIRIQATRVDNPFVSETDTWTNTTTPLVLSVIQDPDEDFDSLPDAWEGTQFGNLSQGPWGDADGDGCPNRLEFMAGSDATNAAVTGSTSVRQWGYLSMLDPVPEDATNLVSIASGWRHMVGIRSNGTVVAWGFNTAGEIAVPAGLTNVLAVAAGKEFSVALKADGTVVGWGKNDYGQAEAKSFLPLKILEISAGGAHVLARMEDGTVRAWGGGDGVTQLPAGLNGVRSLAAGTDSGMIVEADRTALGWGFSQTNTGVDGNFGQAKAPANATNVRSLVFGGFHTLALTTNGTVLAWGSNSDGQSTVPATATNVVKIAAGLNSWHSLALRVDGTVVGWGASGYGAGVPSDLTNAVDLAAGYFHGAALSATVTTQAPPNRPPTDISLSLSGGSVAESATSGSTVGLLVVTDPDAGDTQNLALVSGTGDADNWMVQVSGMSLLLNTTLNYEFKSSLSIRVRTTDSAGNTLEKSFTVPVGNVLTDDDDYDGLTEAEEIAFGTSTNSQDTDGDGYLDYAEKMAGTAGNSAQKVPNEIKDFIKFQTMVTGPETRSFVFFTRMNHKHTVMSSTNLVNWTNDTTIYPTNPFVGTGRHTNMSIYTYSPKFFMKIVTESNTTTTHPPGGGGGGGGMPGM